ncbi:hypothetical protein FWH09_02600 [Candidatus Saccharibacteria bacterium]|nr:hypothetical protein [Candidatus Saccharibacteria bacterium]
MTILRNVTKVVVFAVCLPVFTVAVLAAMILVWVALDSLAMPIWLNYAIFAAVLVAAAISAWQTLVEAMDGAVKVLGNLCVGIICLTVRFRNLRAD